MASKYYTFLDDDDADFLALVSLTQCASKKAKWSYDRIDFDKDLERLRWTGGFPERYHMSERSFDKLVDLLAPKLQIDERPSRHRLAMRHCLRLLTSYERQRTSGNTILHSMVTHFK